MTTREDKRMQEQAEQQVEKIQEAFYDAAFEMIWDMRSYDMKRSEITKIMIRDLKSAIEVSYEDE